MKCVICGYENNNKRAFATHLQQDHNLTSKEYTWRYILFLKEEPKCAYDGCNNDVRYVGFTFKQYCKEHAKEAMKKGGKKGGKAEAWNKGQTKETNKTLQRVSDMFSGSGNPFYGKNHTEESKQKRLNTLKKKSNVVKGVRKTKEQFIKEAKQIHGNKYDYSLVEYKNTSTKVAIKCLKHNEIFYQRPHGHLGGKGCKKCGYEKNSETLKDNIDSFIEKAIKVHGNSYSYDDIEYKSCREKINIYCNKCKKHYEQVAYYHLAGNGCQRCANIGPSKEEQEVADFVKQYFPIIQNIRDVIPPKELDIYIPSKAFAIEYNGLYYHSDVFGKDKKYHLQKTEDCREKNIKLFHIFSDEWKNKQNIVKSMIKHRLGISENKIYARKCSIKPLKNKDVLNFFNETHISGHVSCKDAFGLFYNNELVACISLRAPFHKKYKDFIEIARFSTKLNTTVVGGFGKLLKATKQYCINSNISGIFTYADRRFGEGQVYENLSFHPIGKTDIDYWYSDGIERYNRFSFRAREGKSEKEVALENSVFKVYGCGSNKYQLLLS